MRLTPKFVVLSPHIFFYNTVKPHRTCQCSNTYARRTLSFGKNPAAFSSLLDPLTNQLICKPFHQPFPALRFVQMYLSHGSQRSSLIAGSWALVNGHWALIPNKPNMSMLLHHLWNVKRKPPVCVADAQTLTITNIRGSYWFSDYLLPETILEN